MTELEQLRQRVAELERARPVRNHIEQLAAAQAREVKLREALVEYEAAFDMTYNLVIEALNQPTDDTALREVVRRAGEVMRERCHSVLRYQGKANYPMISTLPSVTLEDLK